LLDSLHPGAAGIVRTEQEIAIAVQKVDRNTAIGEASQGSGDPELEFAGGIVTDPALEQITENVERPGVRGAVNQELLELLGDVGTIGIEMDIGDEQPGVGLRLQGISTRWITTGSTGTSVIGPLLEVSTERISSTTSMPSVTRPNTA
jgi:hypothetical protein